MPSNRLSIITEQVPASLLCLLYVFLFALLSEAGLMVYNRWNKKAEEAPQSNEVAGLIFGALSLIYSLILAFVIVAVWTNYDNLSATVEQEADKLNSILAHSETLPDSLRKPLANSLFSYCNQVVQHEWKMQEGPTRQHPSAIPALRLLLLRLEPQTKMQERIYAVMDDDLSCISDLRRDRLDHTRSHVPNLIWVILKAGSAMIVVFSYFLNATSEKLKRMYIFFLSSIIAMSLFLVYTLDHPFTGSTQVSKKPYETILLELKQYLLMHP